MSDDLLSYIDSEGEDESDDADSGNIPRKLQQDGLPLPFELLVEVVRAAEAPIAMELTCRLLRDATRVALEERYNALEHMVGRNPDTMTKLIATTHGRSLDARLFPRLLRTQPTWLSDWRMLTASFNAPANRALARYLIRHKINDAPSVIAIDMPKYMDMDMSFQGAVVVVDDLLRCVNERFPGEPAAQVFYHQLSMIAEPWRYEMAHHLVMNHGVYPDRQHLMTVFEKDDLPRLRDLLEVKCMSTEPLSNLKLVTFNKSTVRYLISNYGLRFV